MRRVATSPSTDGHMEAAHGEHALLTRAPPRPLATHVRMSPDCLRRQKPHPNNASNCNLISAGPAS